MVITDYKIYERISVDTIIRDQGYDNLKGYRASKRPIQHMCQLLQKGTKDLQKFVNKRIKT